MFLVCVILSHILLQDYDNCESKGAFSTTCVVHVKSCDSLEFRLKKARRWNVQKLAREQEMLKRLKKAHRIFTS